MTPGALCLETGYGLVMSATVAEPAGSGADERARVAVALSSSYEPAGIAAALREVLAPLGGIGAFVKPGQTVLLKPNLLSPRVPAEAVTTHPAVVRAVIDACFAAGAARVWVGDSCAGDHAPEELWSKTGLQDVVAAVGGELKAFAGPVLSLPCSDRRVPVPEWFRDVDVLISLPKLKTHMLTTLTCALKNLYGMVPGRIKALYHGTFPSPRSMSAFLVDVFAAVRPALTVVDAVHAMEGDGPANGQVVNVGLLMAGTDAVALDSVCARFLRLPPMELPMVRIAAGRGLGVADLRRIDLVGDGLGRLSHARLRRARGRFLQRLPEPLFGGVSWFLRYRPWIDDALCVRCGVCARICSQGAVICDSASGAGALRIDRGRCILCLCCMESCPQHAITVKSLFWRFCGCRPGGRRAERN